MQTPAGPPALLLLLLLLLLGAVFLVPGYVSVPISVSGYVPSYVPGYVSVVLCLRMILALSLCEGSTGSSSSSSSGSNGGRAGVQAVQARQQEQRGGRKGGGGRGGGVAPKEIGEKGALYRRVNTACRHSRSEGHQIEADEITPGNYQHAGFNWHHNCYQHYHYWHCYHHQNALLPGRRRACIMLCVCVWVCLGL